MEYPANPSALAAELWEQVGGEEILGAAGASVGERFAADGGMPAAEELLTTLDGRELLTFLAEQVKQESGGWFASLGSVLGLLILLSVWKRWRDTVHDSGSGALFSLFCTASLAVVCFTVLSDGMETVRAAAASLHTVMTTASAVLTALTAARGMMTAAAVSSAGMALLLTAMETVTGGVLLPLVRICGGFALAALFDRDSPLGCVGRLLRKNFLFLTGALMALLTAVLSFQTVLASASDSLAMRTARFTLSSAVPVIGSAIGDAVTTVSAAVTLVGKTAGLLGAAVILLQLLPPIVSVFGMRLLFQICACAAELLSLGGEAKLLHETEELAGFLCAVLASEGVFYVLMLAVCMKG